MNFNFRMTVMITYDVLSSLASEHGTSFYIFYPDKFINNLNSFRRHLTNSYSNSKLAYALKANYMPVLSELLDENGYMAEVVSGMEYSIARLRLPGERLIFNGPCKTVEEIDRAISEGAVVNIDSFYELGLLKEVVRGRGNVGIGLRVNFDIGTGASRFGFNFENGEFMRAVKDLSDLRNVTIISLHSHFTTKERSIDLFKRRVDGLLSVYDAMPEKDAIQYLNIGGGFFGPMSDEAKSRLPIRPPSYAEYAAAIGQRVSARFPNGGPQLVVEPGVSMIADAMDYVVQVLDDRLCRDMRYLTVDGSVNCLFPTGSRYTPDFSVCASEKRNLINCHVAGYTCMEHDILMSDVELAAAPGDFIVFHNRGAYSNVYKPPFIKAAPPIIGTDGAVYAHRQSFEEVIAPYVVGAKQ